MAETQFTATTPATDAVTILREDHEKILNLLLQFRDAKDAASRKGIVDNLVAELETHSLLEEELVFPAVRRLAGDEAIVDEAEADHRESDQLAGVASSPSSSAVFNKCAMLETRSFFILFAR